MPQKRSFGNFQNPNFDNEDIEIHTAPQRSEHFQEGRMQLMPPLSEGREPSSYPLEISHMAGWKSSIFRGCFRVFLVIKLVVHLHF